MSANKNAAAPKRIIIIGCGPGGCTVANGLSKSAAAGKAEVTILEKKDHVDLCIPHPRSMVNAAFAQEVLLTHDRALFFRDRPAVDRTRLVNVKEITAISDGVVKYITRDGASQEDEADAIIVATGSSYKGSYIKNNDGLFRAAWLKKLAEWRAAAGKANHILIIGGGVTGVEVVGELATEHPACKVTLIHGGKHLCNHTEKYHAAVMLSISKLPGSVEVILEDRVDAEEMLSSDSPKTFTTRAGKTIADVDMVLLCSGASPNTSFISPDKLNEKREIVVDNTLQAPALTSAKCSVFAIGDVTQCGYGRSYVAALQAEACVKNLQNIIDNKPLKAVYNVTKQPFLPVMISLGRTQGVASVPWVNNWLGRMFKAADLMASFLWKKMGQKAFVLSEQAKGPSLLARPATSPATDATPA